MKRDEMALAKGLPTNLDAERFILGSVLMDGNRFPEIAASVSEGDFALESHRRIFNRMQELHKRGEKIDRVTVANEHMRFGELESIGGLSYLVSLDDGLPRISNLDSYVAIIRSKATLRRLAGLYQNSLDRCLMAEEEPQTIIEASRAALMTIYDASGADEHAETAYEIVQEAGGVNGFFSRVMGVPSPWPKVDFFTGGWQSGELILVGARPSMGKTAFALNLLWGAASAYGKHSVFYSYEMDRRAIIRRLVSLVSGISYQSILQMHLTPEERDRCRQALNTINDAPVRVVQSSGKSILSLRAHAEKLKHRGELDMIAIDYIGLMRSGSKSASNNRNQELGDIARELKRLAMDLNIPVICLSQLNRAVENRQDKRPAMSDLRDSGEIEEHADLIGFLHRPGYYNRDDAALQNVAEFIIAKQRNGDTPLIDMAFVKTSGRFLEELR
jgi:replicative DNA helicase